MSPDARALQKSMQVIVKFAGPLRSAAGVKQMPVQLAGEATTGAVLRAVAEALPGVREELFGSEPKEYFSVFVNDLLVPEKDRNIALVHDGDQVLFLLPVAGGMLP